MVEKRQNKWFRQKQHFYCSPAMSKSCKFPKKWFWRRIRYLLIILKGWQCFLFIREHFLSFKKCGANFDTVPESFLRILTLF